MFPLSQDDLTPSQPVAGRWSIHDVGVEWRAADPRLVRLIRRLMRGFPAASRPAHVVIDLTSGAVPAVPPKAERLPPSNNEIVDNRKAYGLDTIFARHEGVNYYALPPMAGAAYAIGEGWAVGRVNPERDATDWQITHLFLLIVLLEMLRGQGLFWMHASCVAREGRGALFAGQTHSGKTTTAINLALYGFDILAEDRVFVRQERDRTAVYGFPLDVAVTPQTVGLLPELAAYLDDQAGARVKRRLPIDEIFADRLAAQCTPALLMFPHVEDSLSTTSQPISRADALRRLLPNSMLASQPGVAGQHFAAISALVEVCRCYELALGRDVGAVPGLIGKLLDEG
jgi:hypothetical protein